MTLTALAVVVQLACAQTAPVMTPEEKAKWLKEVEADRADTKKWLRSDQTSYFAAVARVSFGDKTELSVGSGNDNDVVVEGLKPRHLKVAVAGDSFTVTAADPSVTFMVGKATAPVREAKTPSAKIGLGKRYALRLSHQGYPAVIVFDAKSPLYRQYKGIPYFPPDPSWRYVVRLTPDPKAEVAPIGSSNSADRKAKRLGWFDFTVGGKPVRLAAHRLVEPGSGDDDLSVFFRDATTGKESYRVGRYVSPKKQADGSYVLDFNMAYNPACAYSNFYNCPIPPKENHLAVAVTAGEKDPKVH